MKFLNLFMTRKLPVGFFDLFGNRSLKQVVVNLQMLKFGQLDEHFGVDNYLSRNNFPLFWIFLAEYKGFKNERTAVQNIFNLFRKYIFSAFRNYYIFLPSVYMQEALPVNEADIACFEESVFESL